MARIPKTFSNNHKKNNIICQGESVPTINPLNQQSFKGFSVYGDIEIVKQPSATERARTAFCSANDGAQNFSPKVYRSVKGWEYHNRPGEVLGFLQKDKISLVSIKPGSFQECEKWGHLVNMPYLKENTGPRVSIGSTRVLIKPFMSVLYPHRTDLKRSQKTIEVPRGKITEFSRKSSNRLLRKVLGMERLPGIFSTLTYSDDILDENKVISSETGAIDQTVMMDVVHRDIHRMGSYIRYKYTDVALIWRIEAVKRKSGKYKGVYVPHWHGLWIVPEKYNITKTDIMIGNLKNKWCEYTGTKNPDAFAVTHSKESFIKLDGNKKVIYYISKYSAKIGKEKTGFQTGRHWGSYGNIPTAKGIIIELDNWESKESIRLLKKWFKKYGKGKNYIKKTIYKGYNAYIYLNEIDIVTLINLGIDMGEIPF